MNRSVVSGFTYARNREVGEEVLSTNIHEMEYFT